jgi:dipeptidyl aminopeptidase/acylaminoacyl peptidase
MFAVERAFPLDARWLYVKGKSQQQKRALCHTIATHLSTSISGHVTVSVLYTPISSIPWAKGPVTEVLLDMRSNRFSLLIATAASAVMLAGTVQAQTSTTLTPTPPMPAAPAPTKNWKPTGPALPLEAMSQDWALWGARISPDGKHIAALGGIPGQNPVVRVWSTEDMSKAPMQFGSRTMRFTGVSFLSNSKLLVSANQPVDRGASSRWEGTAAIANLDGSSFMALAADVTNNTRDEDRITGYALFNRLPKEEDFVLIQLSRVSGTEIVRLNIKTGRQDRFARTGDNESFDWADPTGQIRVKSELRASGGVWTRYTYYRDVGGDWREMTGIRQNLNQRFTMDVQHVTLDGKFVYIITDKDRNFAVLQKYDLATHTLSAPIVENTEFDISQVSFGTADDPESINNDPLRTVCWSGPATECIYNDPVDKRLRDLLGQALPGTLLSLSVRSSGNNVLVSADAPNFPTTYYLLKNERQLVRIGSALEGWDRDKLGPAQWINYPARDGLMIPSVLTLPVGYNKERDGSLPLVVLPHGGPWSRDDMGFDMSFWPQLFATRGFAVLQPNYRGSTGLGARLWKAGDNEWGGKMQDDKDDGARWLVAQGIADPNRMMMYGYSYGGFAAAAAAARSGSASAGLYQCAISGAPAIDLARISNDWGDNRLQRVIQGVTVGGWDPMRNLDQVKIPWFVFHGDYDRQADTIHSRSAAARMRQVNPTANFRYLEIPKMSHTLGQMTPAHRTTFLTEMLRWVDTNCGNISTTFSEPGLPAATSRRASR